MRDPVSKYKGEGDWWRRGTPISGLYMHTQKKMQINKQRNKQTMGSYCIPETANMSEVEIESSISEDRNVSWEIELGRKVELWRWEWEEKAQPSACWSCWPEA